MLLLQIFRGALLGGGGLALGNGIALSYGGDHKVVTYAGWYVLAALLLVAGVVFWVEIHRRKEAVTENADKNPAGAVEKKPPRYSPAERRERADNFLHPPHIQADPAEQVFVSTSGKRKIAEGMVAIGLRLISIPLFNGSEHGASEVKAVVEVYPESDGAGILDGWQRPGVIFAGADPIVPRPKGEGVRLQTSHDGCLDRSHGRWRELGRPSRQEFEAGVSQGLARGINFPPDRQRHLLDVLGQERPQTRIFPGWQIVRYPVEATTSGAPLQEGIYRLEITLRSPDFKQPVLLIYRLEIPPSSSHEGHETAPRLTLRSSAAG